MTDREITIIVGQLRLRRLTNPETPARDLLQQVADATGWEVITGTVVAREGRQVPHAWMLLPDGSILDADRSVITPAGPEVLVVPSGGPQDPYRPSRTSEPDRREPPPPSPVPSLTETAQPGKPRRQAETPTAVPKAPVAHATGLIDEHRPARSQPRKLPIPITDPTATTGPTPPKPTVPTPGHDQDKTKRSVARPRARNSPPARSPHRYPDSEPTQPGTAAALLDDPISDEIELPHWDLSDLLDPTPTPALRAATTPAPTSAQINPIRQRHRHRKTRTRSRAGRLAHKITATLMVAGAAVALLVLALTFTGPLRFVTAPNGAVRGIDDSALVVAVRSSNPRVGEIVVFDPPTGVNGPVTRTVSSRNPDTGTFRTRTVDRIDPWNVPADTRTHKAIITIPHASILVGPVAGGLLALVAVATTATIIVGQVGPSAAPSRRQRTA